MAKKKKWIVALMALDEDTLGPKLLGLPDVLHDLVTKSFSNGALNLDMLYLLDTPHKQVVEKVLEHESLPFHDYAVDICGETCDEEGCDKHCKCQVIQLHAKRSRC